MLWLIRMRRQIRPSAELGLFLSQPRQPPPVVRHPTRRSDRSIIIVRLPATSLLCFLFMRRGFLSYRLIVLFFSLITICIFILPAFPSIRVVSSIVSLLSSVTVERAFLVPTANGHLPQGTHVKSPLQPGQLWS